LYKYCTSIPAFNIAGFVRYATTAVSVLKFDNKIAANDKVF
jgi:hypothetical protein